jgi:plastin-1
VWQLVELCVFASISSNIKNRPELKCLLNDGEDLAFLSRLPPEEILLRWFNFHLKKAGSDRVVGNFSTDIQDSVCYHLLLNQINPESCNLSGLKENNLESSAQLVITNANKMGCGKFLTFSHVIQVIFL